MTTEYEEFLASKRIFAQPCGFDIDRSKINPMMLDPKHEFQADIVQWACKRGKAAIFANTGLGKGPMQMEWCRWVCLHTGGDCLIVGPLAVAQQFVREAAKFSIPITLCKSQEDVKPGINVTNYERLDLFDLSHFKGVSLDESSCIKDFTSKTTKTLIEKLAKTPYKLCSSATPSPNAHGELGTHAEILDVMSRAQMLAMFFEHDGGETSKWALKGHGKKPFWKFVASWAVCISTPADLGYDGTAYILPPLNMQEHIVAVDHSVNTDGMLYRCPDMSATGLHKEMRLTARERATKVSSLIASDWSYGCKNDGSLSTKTTEEKSVPLIQNTLPSCANSGSETQEHQKKTPSTCEPTTQQIKANGTSPGKRSRKKETPKSESSTQQTLSTERNTRQKSENGPETTQSKQESKTSESTGCQSNHLTPCLSPKTGNALFADTADLQTPNDSLLLTTAIQREESEDFCARHVTSESGNSETIRGFFSKLSNTSNLERWIVWCNTNYEQKPLLDEFGSLCISIDGSMKPEEKESRITRWLSMERPILLTKPSVAGFGLNFQHCRNMAFVGLSYSFESFFQAARRCWRFGQTRQVNVHVIVAETEGAVLAAIREKESQYEELQREMNEAMREEQLEARHKGAKYEHLMEMEIPTWLLSTNE